MPVNPQQLENIIEAALLAAGKPLNLEQLAALFTEEDEVTPEALLAALRQLAEDCAARGIELKEVASGYRMQVKQGCAPWVLKLFEERPPRYSRAVLETLALIAYRQPVSRAEIEDVRGVAVSSNVIKTLLEREWVRVVGHREVPGRPALYGTTRAFLDHFNLKGLDELPPLAEVRSLEEIAAKMDAMLPELLAAERAAGEEERSGEEVETGAIPATAHHAAPDETEASLTVH